jgi:hypothetical protein
MIKIWPLVQKSLKTTDLKYKLRYRLQGGCKNGFELETFARIQNCIHCELVCRAMAQAMVRAPLKRRSTSVWLHGSTFHKTLNFILAAVRTWNLTENKVIYSLFYDTFSVTRTTQRQMNVNDELRRIWKEAVVA